MDFDGDALADLELVDMGAEGGDRAHVFMAWGKVLVEGQAALNAGRRSAVNDLEVGCADRNRVDADQNLGAPRNRRGLVAQEELVGPAEHPSLHLLWNGELGSSL